MATIENELVTIAIFAIVVTNIDGVVWLLMKSCIFAADVKNEPSKTGDRIRILCNALWPQVPDISPCASLFGGAAACSVMAAYVLTTFPDTYAKADLAAFCLAIGLIFTACGLYSMASPRNRFF